MKLNLGASDRRIEGYVSVDIAEPADECVDLTGPWPWEDSSVDEIIAQDVFEHLPDKRHTMNEAWRVLRPGGVLDLAVPCVALLDGRVNYGAFADPTHVSFWTPDDRYYFCEEWNHSHGERGRLGPAYGIKALFRQLNWEVLEYGQAHERRSKIYALFEAIK